MSTESRAPSERIGRLVLFSIVILTAWLLLIACNWMIDDIGASIFAMGIVTLPILAAAFYVTDERLRQRRWARQHPIGYFSLTTIGLFVGSVILTYAMLRVVY